MKLIKFRRQYLITAQSVPELENWQRGTFNGMNVYAEQSLQVFKKDLNGNEFLLLGYWINPHCPDKDNSAILGELANSCDGIDKVLEFIYCLSGRFALFCRFGDKAYGVSDAGGFRPIFYNYDSGKVNLTSNIYLLRYVMDLKEKPEKSKFEHSDFYRWSPTFGWCPGYTFYQNVDSLIANHYLNINEGTAVRFYPNRQLNQIETEDDINKNISKISEMLKNSIAAIVGRCPVSFSLTSGYDSRMILSTVKEYADKMYFWISYYSHKQSDYFLPKQILADAGLKRHPIRLSLRKYWHYRKFYFENTPMAHSIWCKYYLSMIGKYPDNMIVIRGSAAGTLKKEYYKGEVHPKNVDISYLNENSNFSYLTQCPFLKDYMKPYLEDLQMICKKNNYRTLDILQQENGEGGQWQAQSQLESDFLHDVFVPLSNREIIDLFLQLPDKFREPQGMMAYKEIIKSNWPELLNYPFNPSSKHSKLYLKMQYYKEAAKFKLRKMFGR